MEIKIRTNSMQAVVTVANVTEAAELLNALGAAFPATPAVEVDNRTDEMRINQALSILKRSKAAEVLSVLAEDDGYVGTDEIRRRMGVPENANIGPMFSNIAMALSSVGLEKSKVFRRHVDKPKEKGGQWLHWYKLTPMAREAVWAFPGFVLVKASAVK